MNPRLSAAERRELILEAAVKLADTSHYQRITRQDIADEAGIAPTLVTHYFGTMPQLRRDVMRYAVRNECLRVIGQGLASQDTHALRASPGLQASALGSLLGGVS